MPDEPAKPKLVKAKNNHATKSFWNHNSEKCRPGETVKVTEDFFKSLVDAGICKLTEQPGA